MTIEPNPGPGEFRCGDCITVHHHMELVTLAVDSVLDHLIGYANGCNEDNRRAISEAVAWVRRP